jgi:hypothetical protein
MSPPLMTGTARRIAMLFGPDDIELVSLLLTDQCGSNLAEFPELLERIRCAVLKLSHGDLNALGRAIDLAKRDWRDALVAAGFGDDIKAHESWWPDGPIVSST